MAAEECSYLFLVRLWVHANGETQSPTPLTEDQAQPQHENRRQHWRGKVQPVLGARTCYFEDWPGLIDALLDMLPQDDDLCRQSGSGEQSDDLTPLLSATSARAT